MMIHSLRSASAVLFYTFGSIVIILVLLTRNTENQMYETLLHILDLPLLLFALVYGGTSLVGSTGSPSKMVTIITTAVLALIFVLFLWFNFSFPISPSGV